MGWRPQRSADEAGALRGGSEDQDGGEGERHDADGHLTEHDTILSGRRSGHATGTTGLEARTTRAVKITEPKMATVRWNESTRANMMYLPGVLVAAAGPSGADARRVCRERASFAKWLILCNLALGAIT